MLLERLFHTDCGCDANGGDEVVSTGMPDAGKRVKLGVERDGAALAAGVLGAERSADVVCAARHGEALGLEEVRERLVRVDFVVGGLGIFPDLASSVTSSPCRCYGLYLLVDNLQPIVLRIDRGEDLLCETIHVGVRRMAW